MNQPLYKCIFILTAVIMAGAKGNCQTVVPKEFTEGTIETQINYLEQRTKIYENYRAIREDMFQKINSNILDSLSLAKSNISVLNKSTLTLSRDNDSLNILLETTKKNLETAITTKNKIRFLGAELNKSAYNFIVWSIIVVLLIILAIGFFSCKRNLILKTKTKDELNELRNEFEHYRQSSRLAREKMSMDHFNEIKKLKGQSQSPDNNNIFRITDS